MTCDVSRTDQAVVKKQLLFKSSNSTEPTRWVMNLSITPHCRLDTQFIYHRHALYQIVQHSYISPQKAEPQTELSQLLTTVVNTTVCGKLLLGFPYEMYEQLSFNNLHSVCEHR